MTTDSCRQSGLGREQGPGRGAAQPEQAQHDPGERGPALRPDLLVERHRIAAHERGLHAPQPETVGIDLVAGGRRPEPTHAAAPHGGVDGASGGHARR